MRTDLHNRNLSHATHWTFNIYSANFAKYIKQHTLDYAWTSLRIAAGDYLRLHLSHS